MAPTILYPRSQRFAEDTCHILHGSDKKHKRGRQKTVTWSMDEKLCEVRHFLGDDAPSLLGMAVQGFLPSKHQSLPPGHNILSCKEYKYLIGDHPTQAKCARFTSVMKPDGNLVGIPPGPGLSMTKRSPVGEVELEASMAIAAPWHQFILDDSWMWAGGEESIEVALQQQRELRLLEAFYPRLASIPDSPAEPQETSKPVDDSAVLLIPLIPLEEEEMQDVESGNMIENNCTEYNAPECREMTDPLKHGTDVSNHGDGILHRNPMAQSAKLKPANLMSDADSNIAAVAAAACMAVKALGESDLVDEKLLLEILKSPSLLKSLTCSNQVIKIKSQVKTNDKVSQISQEPITGLLDKLLPEYGADLNASPVSVLATWEEGAITGSPYGTTPITDIRHSAIALVNPLTTNLPVTKRLPSQASHKTTHIGRDFLQKGFEIPETCMSSPFNHTNLQSSPFVHAYKPKGEVRPSCQNGLRNNLPSGMQSMPAVTPSIGPSARSLLGDPPLGRLVQDTQSKTLQAKKTVLGVPANKGGGGRAKRFCMYFNSPRGCRNGGSCAFLHQSLDSELNTMAL